MNAEIFLQEAKQLEKEIVENRRWLHAHAETGFALNETLPFIMQKLENMGYVPVRCGI